MFRLPSTWTLLWPRVPYSHVTSRLILAIDGVQERLGGVSSDDPPQLVSGAQKLWMIEASCKDPRVFLTGYFQGEPRLVGCCSCLSLEYTILPKEVYIFEFL